MLSANYPPWVALAGGKKTHLNFCLLFGIGVPGVTQETLLGTGWSLDRILFGRSAEVRQWPHSGGHLAPAQPHLNQLSKTTALNAQSLWIFFKKENACPDRSNLFLQ